jgi:hypothetical protein
MRSFKFAAVAAAGILAAAGPAFSASSESGQGQAVITILAKGNREAAPAIQPQDLQVKINGKPSGVTGWEALRGAQSPLELVILIDGSARSSLGSQVGEIQSFVKDLPLETRVALAYMENGRAAFSSPLSSDPAQVMKGFHLPGGAPGQSGSPYFCLSDLAKHWPSQDRTARREVVMITDGVDNYNPRYDPTDSYVTTAINDSVRAGLVVYSIYWTNSGRADNSPAISSGGQNLLPQVAEATGGASYWQGIENPVSFEPYFKDLRVRFENQYRLSFSAGLKNKPEVQGMNLKVGGPASSVTAPKQVLVSPASGATGD